MPENDGDLISRSRAFVQEHITPVLEREPALRAAPDEYTHMVKFQGGRRVSRENLIQAIRSRMAQEEEISLYTHMPICRYRCGFCHYPVIVSGDPSKRGLYVDALCKESKLFLNVVPEACEKKVTSLYFGGGTPTLMSPEEIDQLMHHFRRRYRLAEGTEISFEGTPETFTHEKVQCLLDAGINRVSVGVQILNDRILERWNRHHSTEQALETIDRLVSAGFKNTNVDLIYGFPGQTLEKLQHDIETVVRLNPEGVTLYRLRLRRDEELRTGIIKLYHEHPEQFPALEEVYAMQVLGRALLEQYGYREGPSGWFSRSKEKIRVYQDRWESQKPLVAFGWHTYSYARDYEYYNCTNSHEYLKAIINNELPLTTGTLYGNEEQQRRFVAFRLKNLSSVDETDFYNRFGCSFSDDRYWSCFIKRLVDLNLLSFRDGKANLNNRGKVLIEEILERWLK